MAQSKLNDLASKFGKGGPPGLGIGLKLLAVGAAAVYGLSQSMFTGKYIFISLIVQWNNNTVVLFVLPYVTQVNPFYFTTDVS